MTLGSNGIHKYWGNDVNWFKIWAPPTLKLWGLSLWVEYFNKRKDKDKGKSKDSGFELPLAASLCSTLNHPGENL